MAAEAPPADPLREFLSGKREYKRHPVSFPVELAGRQWEFAARCIDVSDGGALLAVAEVSLERAFLDEVDDYLGVLGRELQGGFDLRFVHHGVVAEAEIIRLSVPPGQVGMLYLGVRFNEALGSTQQARLGLHENADRAAGTSAPWLEAAPLERLPLVLKPGQNAALLIYDNSPRLCGPRFAAQVTALGDCALAVRLDGLDPTTVTARLGSGSFHFNLVSGGTTVWSADATLIAARYLDSPGGGVEIALLANDAPTRRAKRLFRKRR